MTTRVFNHKLLPNTLRYLDGEKIYKQWVILGGCAYSKLVVWCSDNKMNHPETGKPPTRKGVWNAMWQWAIDHPVEAKKLFDTAMQPRGQYWTENEWREMLHSRARDIYKNSNVYRKFVQSLPLSA